jgi:hypothetical protein
MGTNAWAGWEEDVIGYLGVPNSKENIEFLDVWQQFEHSKAHNNPLNLTKPTGVASINSNGVQSYATAAQGALYTANNIKRNYPTIYGLLQGGNPLDIFVLHKADPKKQQALIKELRTWGSGTYADYLQQLAGGGTGGLFRDPNTGKDIPAYSPGQSVVKWSGIGDFLAWIQNNWGRVAWVFAGAILVIIALVMIGKSAQSNTFTFARGDE